MQPSIAGTTELTMALVRRGGLTTARELCALLGISQPSLSRLVARADSAVLSIGRARAARYAPVRDVRAFGHVFPVYRVATGGRLIQHGNLFTLYGGRTLWRGSDGTETLFDGLPWFCDDMRPQGFLGRLLARAAAPLGVPADPREWSDDDVLAALVQRGEDCVGHWLLGSAAAARYLERATQPPLLAMPDDYPALALATLQGAVPGSSAGGEQPKFTCVGQAEDGMPRHLLVKFSPPVAEGPAARRWGDLLVCEHLALQTLAASGIPVARTAVVEAGGRILLEVERFDRTLRGRIGVVSAAAIDAHFVGGARTWTWLAQRLTTERRLAAVDGERLALLELFGAMIGNSDMHLGNVSFFTEEHFALAPCYDMLPMAYAPVGRGEVLVDAAAPTVPELDHANRDRWLAAAELAESFWRQARSDARLGGRLDAIAAAGLQTIAMARQREELLG